MAERPVLVFDLETIPAHHLRTGRLRIRQVENVQLVGPERVEAVAQVGESAARQTAGGPLFHHACTDGLRTGRPAIRLSRLPARGRKTSQVEVAGTGEGSESNGSIGGATEALCQEGRLMFYMCY